MDDGDTILVDLVNSYKNWHQNKKGCQSRINSHPQIEKLANINFEKVINKDKTSPKFVQASARILYTPPMKTLENNIFLWNVATLVQNSNLFSNRQMGQSIQEWTKKICRR